MFDCYLIATSAFGMESLVARQLKELGYEDLEVRTGSVRYRADSTGIARSNLWLRCADRVLVELASFTAEDFGILFDGVFAIDWSQWIPSDGSFPVRARSAKSKLSSTPACQRIVKKAVVEKLLKSHNVTVLPETGSRFVIEVTIVNNTVTIALDSSGEGLNRRGYRELTGTAPLKETVAAAMVLLSYWNPDRPLIDPFCGTGTIPVEAALIGTNRAPGMHRRFDAEKWPNIGAQTWKDSREETYDSVRKSEMAPIIGLDHDKSVISQARHHARKAEVGEDIRFDYGEFANLRSDLSYGCIICNPPYGERMGNQHDVESLYLSMPRVLREFPTWSHYVLSSWTDFEQLIAQRADRRRKLYNGPLACTLYQFFGPKPPQKREEPEPTITTEPDARPLSSDESVSTTELGDEKELAESAVPAQAFGGVTSKMSEQADLFRRRLANRARHLRRWPTRRAITCYRLYDRDVPEIPLVVDRYEDFLHIAEYERPHDRTAAEHADWLDLMVSAAAEELEICPANVFLKYRVRQAGKDQYGKVSEQGKTIDVSEAGLKFRINLSDYLDTGLFLDHRVTRGMVRDDASDKRFLNLFGYTGSFSVYAAAGGACSTTTVDLSSNYLAWAQNNMSINGFESSSHRFVNSDALEFLRTDSGKPSYDLAVVDPPTFSNSKKLQQDWDIQRDYIPMFERLRVRMRKDGRVYFSTNFRRFKLDPDALPGWKTHEISRQTVPEDFRNSRIHRCWVFQAQ